MRIATTLLTTLVGVPIDSAGYPNGLERMPQALRDAGIARYLNLRDDGDLPVAIAPPERDRITGIIGFESVCKTSDSIRAHIKNLLARGERPLVLGGCCTILIGIFAALREHYGRAGLAFVDGHLDFYDGRSSPTGEAADMELAILLGIGPTGLVGLAGTPPLVSSRDVVVFGHRDAEEALQAGALNPEVVAPGITLIDAQTIRKSVPSEWGIETAKRFESNARHFWLHLDLDVLDKDILPAVDYPMPDGLNWEAVAEFVGPLAHSPALIGVDITIYNPRLDPDGQYAKQIVAWLAKMLST